MFQKRFFIILILVILILALVGFFVIRGIGGNNNIDLMGQDDSVDLFPFGEPTENTDRGGGQSTQDPFESTNSGAVSSVGVSGGSAKNVFKAHNQPSSGIGLSENGVYIVNRATGHIYEHDTSSKQTERVSNTTVPSSQRALVGENGSVLYQYINTDYESIESVWGVLNENGVETEFLPNNISSVAVSPAGNKYFYLIDRVLDVVGIDYTQTTGNTRNIFNSSYKNWNLQWFSPNQIAFTSAPTANTHGSLYFFSVSSRSFNKILSADGLTTLVSPEGSFVLYARTNIFGGFDTYLYNVSEDTSQELPITTLPEKCTWFEEESLYCAVPEFIQQALYPDDWYKGEFFFNDVFWKVDINSFATDKIMTPQEDVSQFIDGTNLIINEDENYLYFINKRDLSAWGIEL